MQVDTRIVLVLFLVGCGDPDAVTQLYNPDLSVMAMPPGGDFEDAESVALESSREATIYYTTDGSTPELDSQRYDGPLSLTESTLLTFIAVDATGRWSERGTELYVHRPPVVAPELVDRAIEIKPDAIFFDGDRRTRAPVDRSIKLKSIGRKPVTLESLWISAESQFTGVGVFRLVDGAPAVLAPGETMTIVIRYLPTDKLAGARLMLYSDEQRSDGFQSVELWGRILDW